VDVKKQKRPVGWRSNPFVVGWAFLVLGFAAFLDLSRLGLTPAALLECAGVGFLIFGYVRRIQRLTKEELEFRVSTDRYQTAGLLIVIGALFAIAWVGNYIEDWFSSSNLFTPGYSSPVAAPSQNDVVVALRQHGDVLVVPVELNDAITLDFTIDSAASDAGASPSRRALLYDRDRSG
jgi:hypothetical protein